MALEDDVLEPVDALDSLAEADTGHGVATEPESESPDGHGADPELLNSLPESESLDGHGV